MLLLWLRQKLHTFNSSAERTVPVWGGRQTDTPPYPTHVNRTTLTIKLIQASSKSSDTRSGYCRAAVFGWLTGISVSSCQWHYPTTEGSSYSVQDTVCTFCIFTSPALQNLLLFQLGGHQNHWCWGEWFVWWPRLPQGSWVILSIRERQFHFSLYVIYYVTQTHS